MFIIRRRIFMFLCKSQLQEVCMNVFFKCTVRDISEYDSHICIFWYKLQNWKYIIKDIYIINTCLLFTWFQMWPESQVCFESLYYSKKRLFLKLTITQKFMAAFIGMLNMWIYDIFLMEIFSELVLFKTINASVHNCKWS